mgnify:CR=1 FL=1
MNIEKTFKEFNSINVDYPNIQELTYTKCPKYIYAINYISDENKIKVNYWLDYGTLLGWYRHQTRSGHW